MRNVRFAAGAASSIAIAMAVIATPASAQSTGTLDFDKEIVVTAQRADKGIAGTVIPDTSKAKGELTQEFIAHQTPGQTVNDIINYLPGVSFQSNDAFGASGGTLTIRGFDASRISETFDGITLNDDGNYALYASELLDPEMIDSVTVNLGTTDVDSPTSSASGSTVNYISHMPSDKMGGKVVGTVGQDSFRRIFAMLDTGTFGPWGTKGWVSISNGQNDSPFNNYGLSRKTQVNGKIYQPLQGNDFISVAGFYNQGRSNFYGSVPLSNVPLATDAGLGLTGFPQTTAARYYSYTPCSTVGATPGTAGTTNTCGSAFDYRVNPVDIGNIRGAMRLTLTDKLVWTMDPSYQFTKANGGGTVNAKEPVCNLVTSGTGQGTCAAAPSVTTTPITGYVNGTYYFGSDLNGDGDSLDTIRLLAPSETVTHRAALTTSLRYDFSPQQSLRIAYAFARSFIRQTGELAPISTDGSPTEVFPVNGPLLDANGNVVQKRDTHSIAELNQISGEYRGKFFDNKLALTIGLRAPFLHRELDNLCFTRNSGGSVSCVFGASGTAYAAANPTYAAPQTRTYNYSQVLPNVGLTYKLPAGAEVFANYSEGFSAPQTTALYQSFWFPVGAPGSVPSPEKTDNFDLGMRYNGHGVSLQVDGWYTHFTNRLGSAYNPTDNTSIYQNLGTVDRYGIDANLSYRVNEHVTAYVFGSYLHSKIQSNIDLGATCNAAEVTTGLYGCTATGQEAFAQTAGKMESAIPQYTFGGRLQGEYGPLSLGIQAKYTGSRFVNDQNTPYYSLSNAGLTDYSSIVYPAKTPAYTLVDLDARFKLSAVGLNDKSYIQLNVSNLFDELYVGGFSGTFANTQSYTGTLTNVQIGSPRTISGSIILAF